MKSLQASEDAYLLPHDGRPELFKVYKRRWVVLLCFCLCNAANALVWITFSPISDQVEAKFNISSTWVNMLSLVFMIVFVPITFPSAWLLDHLGLWFGVMVGAVFTMVGAWVRVFGEWNFWPVFGGQVLAAIGQPFILNAVPLLAANYFPPSQRTIVTAIASIANPIGVGIGFVLPPLLTDEPDDIPFMLMIQAIIASACSVFVLFCPSKPPLPPSAGTAREELAFLPSVKAVVLNHNFWILCVEFGCGLGAFNTLATVINQLYEPYGYTNTESGILGLLVVVCGIIGSGIEGGLVDYTHRYKLFIWATLLCATGSLVGMTLLLERGYFVWQCLVSAGLGFFMTPILPLTLELAVEITYPVGEATVTGMLMVSGQLVGIGLIFLFNWMIDNHYYHESGWVATGLTGFSCAVMLLFTGRLKRREHEAAENARGDAINA